MTPSPLTHVLNLPICNFPSFSPLPLSQFFGFVLVEPLVPCFNGRHGTILQYYVSSTLLWPPPFILIFITSPLDSYDAPWPFFPPFLLYMCIQFHLSPPPETRALLMLPCGVSFFFFFFFSFLRWVCFLYEFLSFHGIPTLPPPPIPSNLRIFHPLVRTDTGFILSPASLDSASGFSSSFTWLPPPPLPVPVALFLRPPIHVAAKRPQLRFPLFNVPSFLSWRVDSYHYPNWYPDFQSRNFFLLISVPPLSGHITIHSSSNSGDLLVPLWEQPHFTFSFCFLFLLGGLLSVF